MTCKMMIWRAILGSLVLLLAACGPPPTPEIVIVKETVLVDREVTREVKVEVVVTSTPEPTTPTPEPRVLFQDDFEEEDPGWDIGETEKVGRFFEGGQYHILIKIDRLRGWSDHPDLEVIDDFDLEVDVTQVSGPDNNQFGIIFRYKDIDNWYAFMIAGDGYFKFEGRDEGESFTIIKWTKAAAIKQGESTNHLRLIANGQIFSLFVNGELLAIVPDNTFRRGDIKLVVGSFSEPDVHIAFDNLTITTIE